MLSRPCLTKSKKKFLWHIHYVQYHKIIAKLKNIPTNLLTVHWTSIGHPLVNMTCHSQFFVGYPTTIQWYQLDASNTVQQPSIGRPIPYIWSISRQLSHLVVLKVNRNEEHGSQEADGNRRSDHLTKGIPGASQK